MCERCAKKHIEIKKKDECPQCKKSIRTNYFFSGKIGNYYERRGRNECRIIVFDDKKETEEDVLSNVACEKHGIINLYKGGQLIKQSDFMDLDKPLPIVLLNFLANTTGPCMLINSGLECDHGCSLNGDYDSDYSELYQDVTCFLNVVEKRNSEMIKNCAVFSLEINKNNDCFCSLSEWGQALSQKKILILNIDKNNPELKEYYMFAIQSLMSFDDLSFTRKNGIIKFHPELPFGDYNSYEGYMEKIISLKKGQYS
jgi:hypothetical protein